MVLVVFDKVPVLSDEQAKKEQETILRLENDLFM